MSTSGGMATGWARGGLPDVLGHGLTEAGPRDAGADSGLARGAVSGMIDMAGLLEMLADFGAERLGRIVRDGFARLEARFAALGRAAASGNHEDCARVLQFLHLQGIDAGFSWFAEACRTHELRARNGVALSPGDAAALMRRGRAARAEMVRILSEMDIGKFVGAFAPMRRFAPEAGRA